MALGLTFVCTHCAHEIEAWDEGDPYYIDDTGERRYAYHPDLERELCTDVESLALCLGCGAEVTLDTTAPQERCPQCAATAIVHAWDLEGQKCPYCRSGVFKVDPNRTCIS